MSAPIILIILIMFVFDSVVSILNYRQRNEPLPENVRDIYDEAGYRQWLSYTMEKLRLELFGKTLSTVMMVSFLSLGLFGWLDGLTKSFSSNNILQALIFLGLFMGFQMILDVPFEWIDTFKIEAKYGFNKTSHKTFWIDQLKGLILGAVLLSGLVIGMSLLYEFFKGSLFVFMIGFWLFLSIVMIVFFILNTKVFVRLFNKLRPIEDGELKDKINALSKKSGFEVKAIFVMDASKRSTKLNAFFSGLGKTREVVLYDTLIAKMSHEQILAVLAHELGHAKHRDTLRMLGLQILIFGLYALGVGFVLSEPGFYTQFGLSGIQIGFAIILFSILIEPLSILIGIPVSTISRTAEYKADAYAVLMTDRKDIKDVMKILSRENFSNLNPHPLTVLLHYSHPPVSQRLKAIDAVKL